MRKRAASLRNCVTVTQIRALEKIGASSSPYIIGIDDTGVGSLAGPIVVAGVAVPKEWSDPRIKDSKLLSRRQRSLALHDVIYASGFHVGICSRDAAQIDAEGVSKTLAQLTEGVALYLLARLPNSLIVQDGERLTPIDGGAANVICLPKADVYVPAVSAASILAKVACDEHMLEQHKLYPDWGFDKNMGYPSQAHVMAIAKYGLSLIHRRSYGTVRNYLIGTPTLG